MRVQVPAWVYDCGEDKTDHREFCITKGFGAGGTYGLGLWHLARCNDNNRSPESWVIGPTYQQVISPLIPTFIQIMIERYGWAENKDFRVVLSAFPRIELIKRKVKHTIFFKSANRPDRLVGSNISHLSGTEPGLWPTEAFQKSFVRVRCPQAKTRQKMLEGTPEGLGNEWERIANFEEHKVVKSSDNVTRKRIILRTSDNPNPGMVDFEGSVRSAYEANPEKIESYLNGLFVGFTKGSAYWKFTGRNVGINTPIYHEIPIDFTWDFGVSPLAWVAAQRQPCTTKGGLYYHRFAALKESDGKRRGLFEACAEFISAFGEYRTTPIHVYGGHDGYSGTHLTDGCAFDQIKKHLLPYFDTVEIRARKAAPSVRDRLTRVNTLYAYERAIIDSDCKNLIESMQQTNLKPGTWDLDKPSGKDKDKRAKDKSHFGDAWGYYLFQETRSEDLTSLYNQNITGFTGRL